MPNQAFQRTGNNLVWFSTVSAPAAEFHRYTDEMKYVGITYVSFLVMFHLSATGTAQ